MHTPLMHTPLMLTHPAHERAGLCYRATHVSMHCDGEDAIKKAFHLSKVFSKLTKQVCVRHAMWSSADATEAGQTYGKQQAKKYHNYCATASCEAEFRDRCEELASKQEGADKPKRAAITRRKCEDGEGRQPRSCTPHSCTPRSCTPRSCTPRSCTRHS